MISDAEAQKIEAALATAIAASDWDAANKCADLLNKVKTMSVPVAGPANKWLAVNATLPIKVHPTEGEGDVVRSDAVRPSGEYL